MTGAIDRVDHLDPAQAGALSRLLGVEAPTDVLPITWHWVYHLDFPAHGALGVDGHPAPDMFIAPPRGSRRMWAGGSLEVAARLRLGEATERRSRVLSRVVKQGRTGQFTVVTIEHVLRQAGTVAIREKQELIYRPAAGPSMNRVDRMRQTGPLPDGWRIALTPPLLFGFSALTWNSHRIHYDRDYACDIEGYDGLVVHGPLQVIAMVESARAAPFALSPGRLEYRLVAPLCDVDGMVIDSSPTADGWSSRVHDDRGRKTAVATFTYSSR